MDNLLMFPFHLADGGMSVIMSTDYDSALCELLNQMPYGRATEIFPMPYCMLEWHAVIKEQFEAQQKQQQQTREEMRLCLM